MSNDYKKTSKTVLVKGLSSNVRSEHVDEIFSNFGEIEDVKIAYFKGHSSGWAYVYFSNHDEALNSILQMNGGNIDGNTISVSLADINVSVEDAYLCSQKKN